MSEKLLDPARHEPTDVGGRLIWVGLALLLASVFVLALIVLWLYPGATTDRTLRLPLPQYPDPSAATKSGCGHGAVLREEMQWLNGTGWIDKANGIAHIPIADAMRIVAEENIPGWPGGAAACEKNACFARQPSSPRSAGDGSSRASSDGESP